MRHGEIDGFNPVGISLFVECAVRAAHRVGRAHAEFGLQRIKEHFEEIKHVYVGRAHRVADFCIDER